MIYLIVALGITNAIPTNVYTRIILERRAVEIAKTHHNTNNDERRKIATGEINGLITKYELEVSNAYTTQLVEQACAKHDYCCSICGIAVPPEKFPKNGTILWTTWTDKFGVHQYVRKD